MLSESKSPVLFRNVGLKRPRPLVNPSDARRYVESSSAEKRLVETQTMLNMPDSDENAIRLQG